MEFLEQLKKKFILCFLEDSRWQYLTRGLGHTLTITLFALLLGIAIGVVVAIVRSTYDKNKETLRPGFGTTLLGIFDGICRLYLTIIRGTPVVVQLLIMYFVISVFLLNPSIACQPIPRLDDSASVYIRFQIVSVSNAHRSKRVLSLWLSR